LTFKIEQIRIQRKVDFHENIIRFLGVTDKYDGKNKIEDCWIFLIINEFIMIIVFNY